MRRCALSILVALLAVSTSGLLSLIIAEPCTTARLGDHQDASCPPACVTCACCAQAAEPALLMLTPAPRERVAEIAVALPRLPQTPPRDILHVPKRRFA